MKMATKSQNKGEVLEVVSDASGNVLASTKRDASNSTSKPLPIILVNNDVQFCNFVHEGKTVWFSSKDELKRRPAGNGLRTFAMHVLKKVEKKGSTTYNEVADELVHDMIVTQRASRSEEKNIRRRVYDALNVLLALKIIRKERKTLLWMGMPASMLQQTHRLDKDMIERQRRIATKKQELAELTIQLIAFKNLLLRNRRMVKPGVDEPNVQLHLPFIVVNTSTDTSVDCWLSSDRRAYMFNFDRRFEIHDDVEVLKRMGMAFGLERGECRSAEDFGTAISLVPPQLQHCVLELCNRRSTRLRVVDATTHDSSKPTATPSVTIVRLQQQTTLPAVAAQPMDCSEEKKLSSPVISEDSKADEKLSDSPEAEPASSEVADHSDKDDEEDNLDKDGDDDAASFIDDDDDDDDDDVAEDSNGEMEN